MPNFALIHNTMYVLKFSREKIIILYSNKLIVLRLCIYIYHASDKILGISLDRSRSRDAVKITVLGVEIRIGRVIEFEA